MTEDSTHYYCIVTALLGIQGREMSSLQIAYATDRLKDQNPDIRSEAVETLGLFNKDSSVVKPLMLCLTDCDSKVRLKAVEALGNVKGIKNNNKAMQAIHERMKDADGNVKMAAILTYSRLADIAIPDIFVHKINDKRTDTNNFNVALDLLFGKYFSGKQNADQEYLNMEFESLKKSWGSKIVYNGAQSFIRELVLSDLFASFTRLHFKYYTVLDWNDKCSQILKYFSDDDTSFFTGIRIYHNNDTYYAIGHGDFGNSYFTQ